MNTWNWQILPIIEMYRCMRSDRSQLGEPHVSRQQAMILTVLKMVSDQTRPDQISNLKIAYLQPILHLVLTQSRDTLAPEAAV